MRYYLVYFIFIIFLSFLLIFLFKEDIEKYDNLIPNSIRWKIYNSTEKEDFSNVWNECVNQCCDKGRSRLGCMQSCREMIKDRLYTLQNNRRNYYIPTKLLF